MVLWRRIVGGLALAVALGTVLKADPARAAFEVCNHTSFVLRSAQALPDGTDGWQVSGWLQLRPGECRPIAKRPPAGNSFYIYAESHGAHDGPVRRWSGSRSFCVENEDFDIADQAACDAAGATRDFARMEIEPGAEEWTHRFREPAAGTQTLRKARYAGLQRLLKELGLYRGRVDAYLGRSTKRAISKAKSDYGISAQGFEADALVDGLLAQRIEAQKDLGLRLCNRTPYEVWASVAYGKSEAWLSRGWWVLEPRACLPVMKDKLPERYIYVYGEAQTEAGWRIYWKGDHPFCVADVKFEIDGSEDCVQRGFFQADFDRIDTEDEGGWEHSFHEDGATIIQDTNGTE